ncbi:MAG: hypothetical protein JWP18_748, partial [Solirubrobacterales bacterium]|nr:hypothetical protein [Solirubrobacterales bacterium]
MASILGATNTNAAARAQEAMASILGAANTGAAARAQEAMASILGAANTGAAGRAQLLTSQLKVLDGLTRPGFQRIELVATAELARMVFPNTGLETWRLALLANADADRLTGVGLSKIAPELFDQLGARPSLAADLAERLASAAPNAGLTATTTTTRAWGRYIALNPTAHRLQMSTVAGTTVGGLIGGDLLLRPDDADGEQVAEEVEQRLVEPWHTGPASARIELFAALRTIDVSIVAFIEGGWDDVRRSGSAAPSKIAHCVVEAVDHTLRALAPSEAVLSWLHRDGRQPAKGMLDQKGNPTRPAKVAYVLRDRPGDRRLVQSQEQALGSLVGRILDQAQGIKHAPGAATVMQAQMLLVTVEALLMQLVLSQ